MDVYRETGRVFWLLLAGFGAFACLAGWTLFSWHRSVTVGSSSLSWFLLFLPYVPWALSLALAIRLATTGGPRLLFLVPLVPLLGFTVVVLMVVGGASH